jgi:hypothetical protein
MILGLALHGCGRIVSGDCAEKANCAPSDGSPLESFTDDASSEAGSEEEGATAESDVSLAEDVSIADRADDDVADETVASSDAPGEDVSNEGMPSPDAAVDDVRSEAVSSGDVVTDVVGPTDGRADACGVSSCTNICAPYFLQCCKSDGTCGCSLLFPPGPCL